MRILNDEEMDAVAGGQAHSVAARAEVPKAKTKNKPIGMIHTLEEEEPVEPGDGGGGDGGGGDGGGGDGGGGDGGGGGDDGGDGGGDTGDTGGGSGDNENHSSDSGDEGGDDPADPNATADTDGEATDGNTAAAHAGIDVKPGADITNLNSKITDEFPDIKQVFAAHTDVPPVITSGNDSTHMENSLHYTDNAIDMRANNISAAQANAIVADLKTTLGSSYFIQYETFTNSANNHIHIQYNGH
jgi:hypothetical protein